MKVAIVTDWLTSRGGAEKVIFQILKIFPDAEIFTSVYEPKNFPELKDRKVHTTFINKFPFSKKKHPLFVSFMPLAFESFDLSKFDLVISSNVACSKGIITKPETLHISYCHTPMRFAWDDYNQYIKNFPLPNFLKPFARKLIHKLRIWDKVASQRVDHFATNSKHVQKRIKKYYQRESTVIYPGIETSNYEKQTKEDFYLTYGRLIAYKRFDLTIEAFNKSQKNLVVIGKGRMLKKLKKLNTNPNTKFLGYVSKSELQENIKKAKALIFPQEEDFGLIPLEAQNANTPVIAFNKGGATETVIPEKTGLFFDHQSIESLNKAINKFEKLNLNQKEIHKQASKFSNKQFRDNFKQFIDRKLKEHLDYDEN